MTAMLCEAFDTLRGVLPYDDVKASLRYDIAEGRAALLLTDLQWDYFFAERLRASDVSEAAIAERAAIAPATHAFLKALQTETPDISKIWLVHIWNHILDEKRQAGDWALRRELVITPAKSDIVLPKKFYGPYHDTPLPEIIAEKGIRTFLIHGGIFEKCINAAILAGVDLYGLNFVLIPDLTATENGFGADYIRSQFIEAAKPQGRGWLGIMDSRDVLETARTARRKQTALTPA